ncbi:MAG: hypothetical protein R3338_10545 [Thermoanaerobaculia bacterium]|nr:hypothetical protein [Thermoanaerobaculia bacterium]
MSRGFVCSLSGIAITIFAWFGPWLWPGWPGLTMLDLAFTPERPFSALSRGWRGAFFVLLIIWNIAVWSAVLRMAWWIVDRTRPGQ